MYSGVVRPDGTPHPADTRELLKQAAADAEKTGLRFMFGAQQTFYLLCLDSEGNPTKIPYDNAGYLDIAPGDRGENIRREICLTLEQMGIRPESSHHEEGPGQNKIDFRFSSALEAADNAMTFQTVVRTAAHRNGLYADFSPKPLDNCPGNGCHINFSVQPLRPDLSAEDSLRSAAAGILSKIAPMTAFLDPTEDSYRRLGARVGGTGIRWSGKDRTRILWMPSAGGTTGKAELRSPDPGTNPYLAFALLIRAGLCGLTEKAALPPENGEEAAGWLPGTLEEARRTASDSGFIRDCLPGVVRAAYGVSAE